MTSAPSAFSAIDHAHMTRALRLAERGLYTTMPNPRVGCVIARGDDVLGEGWHQRAGEPHAEVFALRAAGARARGATAYVTLEPCSHVGRTPPCAAALIAAGVGRVVAASEDSNPQVAGGGFAALRAADIVVETGLMRDAARELNRGFFSRVERGRPWLRVKLATSLDGRIALANGESKWITGEAARADVQRWRARSSAILTGSGTVLADDPRLTVRPGPRSSAAVGEEAQLPILPGSLSSDGGGAEGWGEGASSLRRQVTSRRAEEDQNRSSTEAVGQTNRPSPNQDCVAPLRVVLDAQLRTPASANLLDGSAPSLFLHGPAAHLDDRPFARAECEAVAVDAAGRLDLAAALAALARRGANEVQVEAGPTLCGALLEAGLVDELLLYVAPLLLGDRARASFALAELTSMSAARRLRVVERRMLGDDERILLRS